MIKSEVCQDRGLIKLERAGWPDDGRLGRLIGAERLVGAERLGQKGPGGGRSLGLRMS